MKLPKLFQWKYFFKILSRKEKSAFFILAAVALFSAILFSVSFRVKHTQIVPSDTSVYTEGMIGVPRFLNPVYADSYSTDRDITQLLFAGLLDYDKDGRIISGLADYQILDDGKTYEFTLKDKIYWSDGEPITADDAIYTIQTIKDSSYKSPLRPQWIGVETEKVSDTVFRLKLKDPYASFLEYCTLKILPKHIWEKFSAENFPLSSYNLNPIGSGPYIVQKVNINKDDEITSINLARNPKYQGKKPHLDRINFAFFSDYGSLAAAFKRGQIQGFVAGSGTDSSVNRISTASIYTFSMPRYFAIFLNPQTNKAFEDPQVRTALNYATNKEEIIKNALDGQAAIVNSPVLADIYKIPNAEISHDYNIQKAGEILDSAGYKLGTDGLRAKTTNRQPAFQFKQTLRKGSGPVSDVKELQKCLAREIMPDLEANGNFGDKTLEAVKLFQEKYRAEILDPQNIKEANGEVKQATRDKLNLICFPSGAETTPLRLTLTVANQSPFKEVAQIIKMQWAQAGITVDVREADKNNLEHDIVKPRNYEALIFGEALTAIPDPFPFWHSSQKSDPGLNFSLYENKDADKLMEELRLSLDQNARNEKLKSLQDLLIKEQPAIFLYNPTYQFIASKDVHGIQSRPIINPSQRLAGIEEWYTQTRRVLK